jgi:hypothetical protein
MPEHTGTSIAIVNLGIGCREVGKPPKGVDEDFSTDWVFYIN